MWEMAPDADNWDISSKKVAKRAFLAGRTPYQFPFGSMHQVEVNNSFLEKFPKLQVVTDVDTDVMKCSTSEEKNLYLSHRLMEGYLA